MNYMWSPCCVLEAEASLAGQPMRMMLYSDDAKEKSTYARGTPIYLTPRIQGRNGEPYLRFSQKSAEADEWTDVKPHITILAADGKEVASTDMEYG